MLSLIIQALQPAWLELETHQNVYKITLVWYIIWDTDADLEVFHTCVSNYLLSSVSIGVSGSGDEPVHTASSCFLALVRRHLLSLLQHA